MRRSKRYRYIYNGDAGPGEKLSSFRLVGGGNIHAEYHGVVALRVWLDDEVELTKYSCDSYSTTEDDRLIGEFDYDVMKWDGISESWKVLDVDVERIGDIELDQREYVRYLHHPKVVGRKYSESLLTEDNFEGAFRSVKFARGDRVINGFFTERILGEGTGDKEKDEWVGKFYSYTFKGRSFPDLFGTIFKYDEKLMGWTLLFEESIDEYLENRECGVVGSREDMDEDEFEECSIDFVMGENCDGNE